MSNYKLNETNKARLTMLDNTFGQLTINFLERMNVQDATSVIDVGCGNGMITHWISEQITKGNVMGVDNRAEQINILQNRYLDATHTNTNLDFRACDAYNLGALNETFDFSLCSLLLKHVVDPLNIIKEIYNILRPGGKLVVFDNAWSNYSCYPHNPIFDEVIYYFKEFYIVQNKQRGYDYGLYAPGDLIRERFSNVRGYIEEIIFSKHNKVFFKLHLESMKGLLLEQGIITDDKFNQLNNQLESIINDEATAFKGTIVNTIGEKIP